mgnify:CR=1 FL=1
MEGTNVEESPLFNRRKKESTKAFKLEKKKTEDLKVSMRSKITSGSQKLKRGLKTRKVFILRFRKSKSQF